MVIALFTQEDITNFELEDCLAIPREMVEKIFTDILVDSLGTKLMPMPGAVECLEQFTLGSKVTIITARPLDNPVFDWLDRFFPDGPEKTSELLQLETTTTKFAIFTSIS